MSAETSSNLIPPSFGMETTSMARLEHFLDAVLRQSLEKVLRERDTVYTMASQCCQLRELFQEMRALSSTHTFLAEDDLSPTPLASKPSIGGKNDTRPQRNHIMVDLGNHFFVQCTVKNGSQVWVNLGCGVVLPMSTEEADDFLCKKEKLLRERASQLSKEALRIKYRIRLVMEAITQLYDRATGQRG